MEKFFEIQECSDKCWVAVMCSVSKKQIDDGIDMYKIPDDGYVEYLIHNKILNKSALIKTNTSWDILNLFEVFNGNLYITSPMHYKKFKVYNITKMTAKCKLYKAVRLVKIIFDYIIETLKALVSWVGVTEIAMMIPIISALVMMGIIWFVLTR